MKRITIALATVAALTATAASDQANAIVRTPDFAREVGEVNTAAKALWLQIKELERIFEKLPLIYWSENRDDLLSAAAASSLAFQKRYEQDPIKACNQARSDNWMVLER